jgi:hypothetical protein
MEQNINLSHNTTECLKTVTRLGHTEYHNICNGQVVTLDWGLSGWIEVLFAVFFASLISFMLFVSYQITKNRDGVQS